ncbi:hypothetical protein BKA61DRAFT_587564 [Leptodontidium sp. MPI-SDFR-AT-0119]|nr:hypothetical protein BKA61DRAFT_587564 [Leptodontidium sp. MPI-SDFR-AT-0119]
MGILMLIPGVGELADVAGMVTLRSFINFIGDINNIALSIHGIVEDPTSAVFTLFSSLLGGRGSRKSFIDAARARRGMTSKELETLTPIRGDLSRISKVRTLCLAKK